MARTSPRRKEEITDYTDSRDYTDSEEDKDKERDKGRDKDNSKDEIGALCPDSSVLICVILKSV
jgi:hypothetical protein